MSHTKHPATSTLKPLVFTVLWAFVLWTLMFFPLTAPHFNFWLLMTIAALSLSTCATIFMPKWWKRLDFSLSNILLGAVIAAALWLFFWFGDKVAAFLFSTARPEINAIYGIKGGISSYLLSFLLLCIIGPAEEIFWRGFVQERLSQRYGLTKGFLIATALYTSVHLASFNFMLIMAALVAGTFWGLLYRLFPQRFTAIIISHALWDAAVFVWFPIM